MKLPVPHETEHTKFNTYFKKIAQKVARWTEDSIHLWKGGRQ